MAEPSVRDLTMAFGERLSLTTEEDVRLALDEGGGDKQPGEASRFCLIGAVLIRKRYNMEAMENTLVGIWRPVKGLHMRVLGSNLFAFYFFHPVDMQRVLAAGPWRFVNHVMVLKEASAGEQVSRLELFEVPFWTQIHGLPPDRMTEATGKRIGGEIGRLVEVDAGEGDAWGVEYIRVRVFIDVRKPLRRGISLSLLSGLIWVDFRYERLPNFCYCCGMLDHIEWDCELALEMESSGRIDRPYGEKLRAVPKRGQQADTVYKGRWIRDASGRPLSEEPRRRRYGPPMESKCLVMEGGSAGGLISLIGGGRI
ncbi:hypothetical protein SLE2022_241560 [Rubroshorea leprosula]